MPPLPLELLHALVHDPLPLLKRFSTTDTSGGALQVICAWPVSGQYGIGERILYYVLVAVCIFARREDWVKKACLGLVLLFPAVAALHGIVLAAVHIDGAVDMDVYGAFQFCAIGALAAPVTVTLSSTYFDEPGRNAIFGWSGIVLAGLLSLTIEFYRANPMSCIHDEQGNLISPDPSLFPYGETQCGFVCSVGAGPVSPIRGGSGNNIDIVPAPSVLTFNAATLVAAACCIPAILLLIWTMIRISDDQATATNEDSATVHAGQSGGDGEANKEGTAFTQTVSATSTKPKRKKASVGRLQKVVMAPVFGAAILAIVIVGEKNLFSTPVNYDTEPMANVGMYMLYHINEIKADATAILPGQWGPIAGVALAVLGSFYLLLAEAVNEESKSRKRDAAAVDVQHSREHSTDSHRSGMGQTVDMIERAGDSPETQDFSQTTSSTIPSSDVSTGDRTNLRSRAPSALATIKRSLTSNPKHTSSDQRATFLRLLAKWIVDAGEAIGLNKESTVSESPHTAVLALPAEQYRNPHFHQQQEWGHRKSNGGSGESVRSRSRAVSFTESVASSSGGAGEASQAVIAESPLQRQATLEIPPQVYGRRPPVPSIIIS